MRLGQLHQIAASMAAIAETHKDADLALLSMHVLMIGLSYDGVIDAVNEGFGDIAYDLLERAIETNRILFANTSLNA